MKRLCGNCKYWNKIRETFFEDRTKDAGQCRIRAPRGFIGSVDSNVKHYVKYRFPLTACDDWCGEFKSKATKKNK
jgi:hypothetical protein